MPLQDAWVRTGKYPRTVQHKVDAGHESICNFILQHKKEFVNHTQHHATIPQTMSSRRRPQYQVHGDAIISLLLAVAILALSIWQIPLHSALHGGGGQLACLIPTFMVLGGSIVHTALAVTTASPRQDSPYFGCGWLSYSLSALLPALAGTCDLLPRPETNCKVLNLRSGHTRFNNSWLLARVLRDLELRHVHSVSPSGLFIDIFDAVAPTEPLCWLATLHENATSLKIMFSQLAISVFVIFAHHDISVFLLFALCVLLMQTITSLPAWGKQKLSARKDGGKGAVCALMRDVGSCYVSIIRNADPEVWNIEDLAGSGDTQYDYIHALEGPILVLVLLSFLAFTILSTQLSDLNAMYMLAILSLGTVGNLLAAALPRESWTHDLNLEPVGVISDDREALKALQKLEETYEGLGETLVKNFFPGGLGLNEKTWWEEIKERRAGKKLHHEGKSNDSV